MKHTHLAPAVYTPMPAYMADPRMAWARFVDGDGAGGVNGGQDKDGAKPDPKEGQQDAGKQGEAKDGDKPDEKLGEPGLRALNAERDARKQADADLKKALDRVKELEDAGKSEDQKRTERLDALEKSDVEQGTKLSAAEATILRYEVAAEKGIDLKAAARLQGSTREEIEKDADEFKKLLAPGRSGGGTQFHREREANGGQGGGSSLQSGRDAYAARHNLTK